HSGQHRQSRRWSGLHSIWRQRSKQCDGDGYALHLVGGGAEGALLYLFRQGPRIISAPVPADLHTLTVAHDGGVTWVEGNGQDLLVYHDAEPLAGPRVALRVAGNDVLYHVKCRREGIIDEVFDKAPAAWVQQGHWVVTNRFSCTPTWSHMTALERGGLGGIWHKDAFPGNVTIEYYAGMRMQSDYSMIYPRCGDFNCTFAARPFSLDTGISLIPGAWDKGWTGVWSRYAQGNNTLVETDRPLVPRTREDSGQRYIAVPYISAGRDVHGAWYYVKSRYVNGKLEGYFDNEKVLSGDAPKADGDRVAFWTQDDQIVLARVRITYENKAIPSRLVDADPVAPQPEYPNPLLLTTNAAPGIAFDFDDSTQGWAPRDRYRDVTVQQGKEGDRRFLLVTNQLPGGSFEAALPLAAAGGIDSLSLDKAAVLRFDYKLPAETRIDLYLTTNSKQYSIPLTGSAEDTPLNPVLLNPGGLTADGQWHTARLPIGAALRERFGKTSVALTDLRFGNLHQGYLLAGFGGNPAGAWYALDSFAIVPEVGAKVALAPVVKVLPKAGVAPPAIKTVRAVLDKSPQTVPSDDSAGANPPTPAEGGFYYLHAQATLEDGTVTPPAHLPLLVVTNPAPLKPLEDNPAWDGGPLAFSFGDSAPTDASLTVGDKTLTFEQAAHFDGAQKRLSLDPSAAGLTFTDGQKVAFKLTATYASGGKEEKSFERVFTLGLDKTPPAPPVISGGTLYYDGNRPGIPFEPAYPQYTHVSVDPSESPDGLSPSFRITNLVPAGQMQLNLAKESVDLAACPVLMFDYKVSQPVRNDFRLYTAGSYFSVTFTDSSGPYLPLATIPNVARDGKWHRAEINLQRPIAASVPFGARMYDLRQLIAMEESYSGEAPGASYWLDNLRMVRVASGAGVKLAWQAADASGIDKYRYVFSEKEDAEPATELPGTQTSESFKPGKDGLLWFSLQACDKAGNWGKPTRMPILVDSTPPVFGTPTPAPGPLGAWNVSVPVDGCDIADLDPAALKFTAGDKTVPVTDGNVVYSPAQKKLVWDWCRATKQFSGRVADGTAVKLGVAGSDAAGNAAAPGSWDYTVTYAADKQPPLAPDVQVPNQPLRSIETFSDTMGSLDNGWGSYRSPVQKVIDPERQDACAQITTTGSGVYLTYGATDLNKHPFLSFDYKMGPNVVLHLMLYCANGTYYSVALNGKDRTYTQIGAAGVAADGKWHTAVIDLGSMVKQNLPSLNAPHLSHIVLSEYGSSGGQTYWLDNVAGFGPMGKDVAASWVAYDATG
ncbi:MAG: hypothetical protein HYU66_05925, partial [Armatimonadetes bacterium]|nr:hypothetical protein [Armatimonadota bacterium]